MSNVNEIKNSDIVIRVIQMSGNGMNGNGHSGNGMDGNGNGIMGNGYDAEFIKFNFDNLLTDFKNQE